MDDLTSAMLAIIVIVLPVVAAILGLVFGIIITGSKTTRIRLLGISFIFTSIYALLSVLGTYAGGVLAAWIFRIIMLILFLINAGIEIFCYVLPANDALIYAENIKYYAVVAECIVTAISMGYVVRRSLRTAWE